MSRSIGQNGSNDRLMISITGLVHEKDRGLRRRPPGEDVAVAGRDGLSRVVPVLPWESRPGPAPYE